MMRWARPASPSRTASASATCSVQNTPVSEPARRRWGTANTQHCTRSRSRNSLTCALPASSASSRQKRRSQPMRTSMVPARAAGRRPRRGGAPRPSRAPGRPAAEHRHPAQQPVGDQDAGGDQAAEVLLGEPAHPEPAVRFDVEQVLRGQVHQRLAHRSGGDPVQFGDLLDGEVVARRAAARSAPRRAARRRSAAAGCCAAPACCRACTASSQSTTSGSPHKIPRCGRAGRRPGGGPARDRAADGRVRPRRCSRRRRPAPRPARPGPPRPRTR